MGLCSKNLNVTLDPCSATTENRQPFDINFKRIHINMRLSSHVQRSGSTWVKSFLVLRSRWILIQMRVWGSQSVVRFYNAVVPESLHNTKFKCRSQLLTFSYIHLSLHVHQTIFFFFNYQYHYHVVLILNPHSVHLESFMYNCNFEKTGAERFFEFSLVK